jgi:hypothetical protein
VIWWKEKDLRAEKQPGIRMKLGEGKNIFVKNDISQNIDTTSAYIQAHVAFMH